jgi:hypothetical protein
MGTQYSNWKTESANCGFKKQIGKFIPQIAGRIRKLETQSANCGNDPQIANPCRKLRRESANCITDLQIGK